VNFLDLSIKFDTLTYKLIFSLYIKPTNSFSYLLPCSNHPQHIFKNIPVSLFLRIRRICSSYIDYLHYSRILFVQLLKRGYNNKVISGVIRNIGNLDRKTLLPYKSKNNDIVNNLKLFNLYNKSTDFIKSFSFNSFIENHQSFSNSKLSFISLVDNNLGSIWFNNFKFYESKKFFSKKCGKNCNLCEFMDPKCAIEHNKKIIPFQSDSNCESTGIIYIIKCNICEVFYVGQSSKSASTRIGQHFFNVNSFRKNISRSLSNFDSQSEVAIHFAESFHKTKNCITVYIFKNNIHDYHKRLSCETDLINLFLKFDFPLLNKLVPNLNKISTLSFAN
jgi:hypothetical protein